MTRITDIMENAERIAKDWLEYGIMSGWKDCGCKKCMELYNAISKHSNRNTLLNPKLDS